MFEINQSKSKIIRNALIRHLASGLSSLWYGQDLSVWEGDFKSGHCSWRGDNGAEFIIIWNPEAILAAASILECSRSIENDDGWDQERSPSGKSRGLQYLAGPPESVQHLYKLALHLLDNEFITAGFWGIDEQVHFSDPNEESLEGGLEYFVEFQAEPHHFLLAKPADYIDSLAEHFGLTESLKPVADLAVKLGLIAFQGKYRINADEKKLFTTENDVVYGKLKVPSNWQDFLNKKFENFGISF